MNETTKHPAHGKPGHSCEIEMQEKRAKWVKNLIEYAKEPDAAEKWARVTSNRIVAPLIPNGFDNIPDSLKGMMGYSIGLAVVISPSVVAGVIEAPVAFTLNLAIAEAAYRLGFEASLGKTK